MESQQLLGARPTQQPMREQRLIERQEILGRRVQRPRAEVPHISVHGAQTGRVDQGSGAIRLDERVQRRRRLIGRHPEGIQRGLDAGRIGQQMMDGDTVLARSAILRKILADGDIQPDLALLHEVHDENGGEDLRHGGDPEAGRRRQRRTERAIGRADTPQEIDRSVRGYQHQPVELLFEMEPVQHLRIGRWLSLDGLGEEKEGGEEEEFQEGGWGRERDK